MKLVLGVADAIYSDASAGGNPTKTTGEVAKILEARFAVMGTFYEVKSDKIADMMAEAISDQIADIITGARPNRDPLYGATQGIEKAFRQFLDDEEMAHIVAGLSASEADALGAAGQFTGAASRGRNSRKKTVESGVARAAFVDTGLYQQSFRAWVEGTQFDGTAK